MPETDVLGGVHDIRTLVERSTRLWPDKIALTFDPSGEHLTFAELDQWSSRIAGGLVDLGVEPGHRVALMLPNVAAFPASWLGMMKAGAVMVPINVHARLDDAGHLIRDSGARVVIASRNSIDLLGHLRDQIDSELIIVSSELTDEPGIVPLASIESAQTDRSKIQLSPHSVASIQYTSGTTGKPKGCILTHEYWLHSTRGMMTNHPMVDGQDILLTAQPFYYIDPQWNLILTLGSGAPLVVLDRFHPRSFFERAAHYSATFFYCLGVMPTLLLKTPPGAADRQHRLRSVLCSGIPARHHAEIEERWGVPWFEFYGSTETGANIAVRQEDHDRLVGSGSIGTPLPHMECRIVDADGANAGLGVSGELLLRGSGFMRGYWGDEAKSFEDGWFRTGDIVRQDSEGFYYFVGRQKDVIKRSGENISASEVEETITSHPAVRLAACVPVPDDVRGEEVKAYVVAASNQVDLEDLIAYCKDRLAYFKVPRYWEIRQGLPMTPSEKIAKWRLRAESADLTANSYDAVAKQWAPAPT